MSVLFDTGLLKKTCRAWLLCYCQGWKSLYVHRLELCNQISYAQAKLASKGPEAGKGGFVANVVSE